ncbi:MAG TPA: DUF1501 domain-containing protein [Bryobacteraceae bacterium]|nr:DUF1501 domain-containing protein [Bryobacteraceae bacterium]
MRTLPLSRRQILRTGALSIGAVSLPSAARQCLIYSIPGGLSHVDTFDMKPLAPRDIRGEFREIPTNVPGIRICEHLPRLARLMDRFTLVRSMTAGETNHERAAALWLAAAPPAADNVAQAIARIESGEPLVSLSTVSMLDVDRHGALFPVYRDTLLPRIDQDLASLIHHLEMRGLLTTTLLLVATEFGRTPRINEGAGRDHHAAAWSMLYAGGGTQGGRVIGATDATGSTVTNSPITPEQLLKRLGQRD